MEYKYVIFVTFVLSSILTLAKSECLDGWVPHLESCYLFVLDMTESWPEAQEICAVFGGRLVEVETQEEEYFINSQLQRWGRIKGGRQYPQPPSSLMHCNIDIDCKIFIPDKLKAVDSIHGHQALSCIAKCYDEKTQQRNKEVIQETEHQISKKCFVLCKYWPSTEVGGAGKLEHAQYGCVIFAGDVSTSDQRRLWLGGNDIQQEGDWIWASDERAIKGQQYSDWAPGQPDNHNMQGHAEHCMTLVPAYGFHWNDEECSVKNYLICEKPRTPSAGNILG